LRFQNLGLGSWAQYSERVTDRQTDGFGEHS